MILPCDLFNQPDDDVMLRESPIVDDHPTDTFAINDPLFSALRVTYYETLDTRKERDEHAELV